jgi:predicted MPP superfamily phosphohydrolase
MFIPKLVMAGFELLELFRSGGGILFNRMAGSSRPISRESFLTQLGLGAAGLTFASFLYGVTWGKYAFRVEQIKVPIPNLPSAFNGFRMVQISDAHLGSFVDTPRPVLEALEGINALKPDVILFTGDLVNTHADEAEPWIEAFRGLHAPLGKFSIMGNHDYADYGPFEEFEREASRKRIKEIHAEMGFRLLLNEHHHFEREGERIALIGVENWGKGFRRSGDLSAAMKGSDAEDLCAILMSHDPTHWEEEVMNGKAPIELTLSGHTHGMQFGIEIPWLGIKWSPSQWRYSRWAGLYEEASQLLHINRGFGVLGFHGRVGMPPEITVLEIEQA